MDEDAAVAAQIGRPLRSTAPAAVRCHLGLPVVVLVPPLLDDGTPFPTRYWLCCPLAVRRVGRLESAGGVAAMERRAGSDPGFSRRLQEAHRRYAAERDAAVAGSPGPLPSGGVGGAREGIKCLHAHYADHVMGHDNPVGELVAPWVEPLDCPDPCVVEAAGRVVTNSTRLLVADVEGGRVRPVERRVVVTGLGAGVDAAGRLGAAGMARTLEALAAHATAARSAGAGRVRAVATSAVRDAADRDVFLGRAAGELGVPLEVIDGDEEAALSFLGAAGGAAGPAPYLVIDVGGGSTEFVFGIDEPSFLRSIDLGSRRITERRLPWFPAGPEALAAARLAAGEALAALALPGLPGTVIGTGGTYTALGAIALGLAAYDPRRVHGSVLTLARLEALAERLASLSLEEIAGLPSLDPARAPVLLGGAVVGAEALRRSGRPELVVSEADLLDGIARQLAGA